MNDQTSNPSVKQQRATARAEKLEAARRQQARADRNRRIWIIGGSVAAVLVIAAIVLSVVLTPRTGRYTAGGTGTEIAGVETFQNGATHVTTAVNYPQTPPTGGDHNPVWLNCGVYEEPQQNENAVHVLEHGAIWTTYNPDEVKGSATGAMNFLTFGVSAALGPLFARVYGQGLGSALDPEAHFRTGGLFWIACTSLALLAALLLRETGTGRKPASPTAPGPAPLVPGAA